ncbi:MAG: ribonuclease HII [Patescibacteria group bacterium]
MPDFEFEKHYLEEGFTAIAGVDEVGRGCLAGPIVAGAVIFDNYKRKAKFKEIDDSKILTLEKRVELDKLIRRNAADFAIGVCSVEEINKFGIGAANIMAFERALNGLKECDFALIDGRHFRGFSYSYKCLEKGESKSFSIAAASIIAKVYRDNTMIDLASEFPEYNFENNKGYGCKKHYEALEHYGPCKLHRKLFLRKFNAHNKQTLF